MKRDVVYCAVILSLLAAVVGILMSRRPVSEVIETVRVDTVFYGRPQPVGISDKLRPIRVPRLLFAAFPDTVFVNKEQINTDSIDITIVRRIVEYADSNYRAVVSGPALGDYGPQLDRFEVFPRTVTRTQTVTKRPRFAVTAGPGVAYTPQGLQLTLGINAGFVLWSK